MDNEKEVEKKDTVVEETPKEEKAPIVEEESDFADEEKVPEPIKKEEPKEEEKKEEAPKVNLYKDEAEQEVAPEVLPQKKGEGKKASVSYDYENEEELASVETARTDFYKLYKKENTIKWIVTSAILVAILLGYLLPNFLPATKNQTWSIYITIGVLAAALIALGLYSFFSKKRLDKYMNEYFGKYYDLTNRYVFRETGTSNVVGTVADKITPEDFNACNLYKDVYKVGSRDSLTFTYHDETLRLVDCAAQIKGQKTLQTVFVGKIVIAPNNYKGEDYFVYLKGNKRALPPTNVDGLNVIEDHKDYLIYGHGSKAPLPLKARKAISDLHTDATLVDLCVSVRAGHTYYLMGYEDTLMVLPLEKPFNPAPMMKFKGDFKKVLVVNDILSGYNDKH